MSARVMARKSRETRTIRYWAGGEERCYQENSTLAQRPRTMPHKPCKLPTELAFAANRRALYRRAAKKMGRCGFFAIFPGRLKRPIEECGFGRAEFFGHEFGVGRIRRINLYTWCLYITNAHQSIFTCEKIHPIRIKLGNCPS